MTLYLLIKRRENLLFLRPLPPHRLLNTITLLGASFIKLAQVLATRSDFFPEAYLEALKTLHDELPPMDDATMQSVFERAFEHDPFLRFSKHCIASASIGQVHEAWLDEETKVAVKLRREGIEQQVRADIRILMMFNRLFRPLFSPYTKHSVEAVIAEFSSMILKEVSMEQELDNLVKFTEAYAELDIRFPVPYPEFCTDDALVMSFEEGIRFDDKEAILGNGIDITALIESLVIFYTEQMLVRGFFHADPHPGNLLVSSEGKLILLDYGMLKRVPNDTRIAIIELIKAANERDHEGYVSAAKRLGIVAYEAPAAELAEFIEQMFEIFADDALDSTSMQRLAFSVLEKTRRLPFKLPQEAIYILRVSAIIEGLGTTYIENFNGVKDILPILEKNIPRALGAQDGIIGLLIDEFKSLPMDVRAFRQMIRRASEGELAVELSDAQLGAIKRSLIASMSPVLTAMVLMLSGVFTLLALPTEHDVAWVLFGLGVLRIMFR